MEFEWDEKKRVVTIEKHGLDFFDAVEIFAAGPLVLPARSDLEERQIAVGLIDGDAVSVIFTRRGGAVRIITVRKARKDERERYEAHVAGRHSPNEGAN